MSTTFADVTPDSRCPGVYGVTLHYPRTVGGRPVTMPYDQKRAHGIRRHIMHPPRGDAFECIELLCDLPAALEEQLCGNPVELLGSAQS